MLFVDFVRFHQLAEEPPDDDAHEERSNDVSYCWMTKVAEVLRSAAQIHARRGGTKGTMQDGNGRVCMWGAIACALGWSDRLSIHGIAATRTLLADEITMVLRKVFQDGSPYPGASWNDRPDVTDGDVQKLLLQVADQCEIGEITLRV